MIKRLTKLAVAVIFHAGWRLCTSMRRLLGRPMPGTLTVLMYHAVPPSGRRRFARQMDYLRTVATPVRTDIRGPLPAGRHHVGVTFDDGFASVLENGLPEMDAHSIPGTFFITTGHMGSAPWWLTANGRQNAGEKIMSEEQLAGLPGPWVSVGSHSVTHPRLAATPTASLRAELVDSRRYLEKVLRMPVTQLALPYGSCSRQVIEAAQDAGYTRLFLNVPTFPASAADFVVGRIDIECTDWALEYRLKILGDYQWLPLAGKLKRLLQPRSARCRMHSQPPRKVGTLP